MDENILGIAKSYLEENGIDTEAMTAEEILDMYYDMIGEIVEEYEEEPTEEVAEEDEVEETVSEEVEPVEETEETTEETITLTDAEKLIADNQEIYNSLNEEQKQLFNTLIAML